MTSFFVHQVYALDRALAAFFARAEHGETLSQAIGLAALDGRWWGRWGSAALSVLVEPDHCERALHGDEGATAGWALVRAGLLLLLAGAAVVWSCWAGCEAALWGWQIGMSMLTAHLIGPH